MPTLYEKLGVRFQFPDNWILDEKEALDGDNSVTVYSPDGAFWSLAIHSPVVRPSELCAAAVKAMRKEYDELDSEPVEETVAGHDLVGFDLNFYCLDLTNTALVRAIRTEQRSLLVLCQAEDREFAQVEPVFRAMMHSLLSQTPATSMSPESNVE
ncbi:MAG: hypothetical protein AB7O62_15450 [Pirellulales bacterium]